jgi:hypothetical protein
MNSTCTFFLLALGAGLVSQGCAVAARSPETYRDDTQKLVDAKQAETKLCYDAVLKTTPTAAGQVKVNFVWEPSTGKLVSPTIDPAGTTAPQPVHACALKALEGLVLNPGDQRQGQGTWTFQFGT